MLSKDIRNRHELEKESEEKMLSGKREDEREGQGSEAGKEWTEGKVRDGHKAGGSGCE